MTDVPHPTSGWISIVQLLDDDDKRPDINAIFRSRSLGRGIDIIEIDSDAIHDLMRTRGPGIAIGIVAEMPVNHIMPYDVGSKVWYPESQSVSVGDHMWVSDNCIIGYLGPDE